jgi:hypothetical protein
VNRATERDVRYQADPTFPSARYGGFGYSRFGSPYWSPYWRYHRSAFGWSRWDPFWGDPWFDRDYTIREIDRYEATAEIVMGRGAPQAGDPRAFDARQIVANLGSRGSRARSTSRATATNRATLRRRWLRGTRRRRLPDASLPGSRPRPTPAVLGEISPAPPERAFLSGE